MESILIDMIGFVLSDHDRVRRSLSVAHTKPHAGKEVMGPAGGLKAGGIVSRIGRNTGYPQVAHQAVHGRLESFPGLLQNIVNPGHAALLRVKPYDEPRPDARGAA